MKIKSAMMKIVKHVVICCVVIGSYTEVMTEEMLLSSDSKKEVFHKSFDLHKSIVERLPILRLTGKPTAYEKVLMTQLRDKRNSKKTIREVTEKLGAILVSKVSECLPVNHLLVETPLAICEGVNFANGVEFVTVMRSGDALLDTFLKHFQDASVSKMLIQRDEETARPIFKYMKMSPTLSSGNTVVILEPMLATGGTLEMVISLLKELNVQEKNIVIASICAAPEGLEYLNNQFPDIRIVLTAIDERLNERKYIVPGLGDFGDRFFGTTIE